MASCLFAAERRVKPSGQSGSRAFFRAWSSFAFFSACIRRRYFGSSPGLIEAQGDHQLQQAVTHGIVSVTPSCTLHVAVSD